MAEHDKFESVAEDYQKRFCFDEYYPKLIEILGKELDGTVLEIGAASGILPDKLNKVWSGDNLEYNSVEPVEKAVRIAEQLKIDKFNYLPKVGTLENAFQACGLEEREVHGLVLSRSLHEIYLGYGRDKKKVFRHLGNILSAKSPDVVILGIVEKYEGLDEEQTKIFSQALEKQIGHGHDPAKDYFYLEEFTSLMQENNYSITEEHHIIKPFEHIKPSPWRFAIGVYRNEACDNNIKKI